MTMPSDAEVIAQLFHEAYESLAPEHGYRTREASAKPWAEVPEQNKALMVATVQTLLDAGALAARPFEADAELVGEIASLRAELAEARRWQEHYELAASDRACEGADWQDRAEISAARVRRLEETLGDLLEVIRNERVGGRVGGTCPADACHWPAVQRQALLAEEDFPDAGG